MVLVAVVVVALAGFAVYRLHGAFGSHKNAAGAERSLERDRSVQPQTGCLRGFRRPGGNGDHQLPRRPCRSATRRQRSAAVVLHDHDHRPSGHRQRRGTGQRQHVGLPHHRQRRRQRREDRQRNERLHLLPGQVRMSNHSDHRPTVPHTIRRLAVPILLFWIALAAIPNILVPQLEEVGQAAQRRPQLPRSAVVSGVQTHRQGVPRVRHRQFGDDRPGRRQAARRRRPQVLRRVDPQAGAGHQARPAHPGLLGRHADGSGIAEQRRQGRLRSAFPCRSAGRGAGQRVRRRGARHAGPDAAAERRQGLPHRSGPAHRRPIHRGQQRFQQSHRAHHRGDRGDVVLRLPIVRHHGARPCHGPHRDGRGARIRCLLGKCRDPGAVDVCDQPAHACW